MSHDAESLHHFFHFQVFEFSHHDSRFFSRLCYECFLAACEHRCRVHEADHIGTSPAMGPSAYNEPCLRHEKHITATDSFCVRLNLGKCAYLAPLALLEFPEVYKAQSVADGCASAKHSAGSPEARGPSA